MPKRRISLEARFWRRVIKTEECWLWTGATHVLGYGIIRIGEELPFAHRVAWMLENGPLAKGQRVLHTCNQRLCVRPSHLRSSAPGAAVPAEVELPAPAPLAGALPRSV